MTRELAGGAGPLTTFATILRVPVRVAWFIQMQVFARPASPQTARAIRSNPALVEADVLSRKIHDVAALVRHRLEFYFWLCIIFFLS